MDKEDNVIRESLKMIQDHDQRLSGYATKNRDCKKVRVVKQHDELDLRWPFEEDIDRVLYSKNYSRYADKTQALSFFEDVHITRRSLHVQWVSRIARQIGRRLNLNLDLIEAIALGHDIGHAPYGHIGEKAIDEMLQKKGFGYFAHNANSVRKLLYIERKGTGYDVSLQALDGILSHNGELLSQRYEPDWNKTKEQFFEEYENCWHKKEYSLQITPMTLEGCVVRISDVIAYIGKDIEDALHVQIIVPKDIPKGILCILGKDNRTMMNRLIKDLLVNSYGKPYLTFSAEVFAALQELLQFIQTHIHQHPALIEQGEKILRIVQELYESFYQDLLHQKNVQEGVWTYMKKMNRSYQETPYPLVVADYVSGMTDSYALQWYEKRFLPIMHPDILD